MRLDPLVQLVQMRKTDPIFGLLPAGAKMADNMCPRYVEALGKSYESYQSSSESRSQNSAAGCLMRLSYRRLIQQCQDLMNEHPDRADQTSSFYVPSDVTSRS